MFRCGELPLSIYRRSRRVTLGLPCKRRQYASLESQVRLVGIAARPRARYFPVLQNVTTPNLWPFQLTSPWFPEAPAPELKPPECSVSHSLPSIADVKNIWSCISISRMWLRGKHLENFYFTYMLDPNVGTYLSV